MNSSNGYQTGGIVLLTMSIVFCGIAVALVVPLIDRGNQPLLASPADVVAADSNAPALAPVLPEYAEFYRKNGDQPFAERQPGIARTPSRRADSRTEQASFAQPVPEHVVVSNRQFQKPRLPPQVNSTQFYTNNQAPTVVVDRPSQPATTIQQPQAWQQPQAAPMPEHATQQSDSVEGFVDSQPEPAAVVDNTPVAHEEGQTPQFAPGQVPAGSVYAPVTVNLDTSMFSDQIRSLERRLEEAAQVRQPAPAPAVAQQPVIHQPIIQPIIQQPIAQPSPQRPRRERVARSEGRGRNERDEDLSRIGNDLKELVSSFRELQQQTNESLREVSRQAERQEAATQVIEAYRLALLRDVQTPRPAVVVERRAVPPPVELPQPTRIAAREVARDYPLFESPRQLNQKADAPAEAMVIPDLIESPVRTEPDPKPAVQDDTSFLTFPDDSTTIVAPPVRTVVQPIMSAKILPPDTFAQPVPLKMSAPQPVQVSTPPELEGFEAIALPLDVDSSALSPVPNVARQVAPVGYANTYRFKVAVSDEGDSRVVPADNVCAQCGKVHGPNEPHAVPTSKIQQTAAVAETKKATAKPDLRRDTKNAGRGMNRKIGRHTSQSKTKTDSPKGFLKLKLPTMTGGKDEPGILHRMSSTIKQMGRSVQ